MTQTPITDNEALNQTQRYPHMGMVVKADFARKLELAANALEEALNRFANGHIDASETAVILGHPRTAESLKMARQSLATFAALKGER